MLRPLQVIVGSNDQPFRAEDFEPVVSTHTNGETLMVNGADHVLVLETPEAIEAVAAWVSSLQ